MTKGIVVLAQNVSNTKRIIPNPTLQQEYKGIKVDIWYNNLTHIKGQHIWYKNNVYIVENTMLPSENFLFDNVKLLVPNVKILKDENSLITHHQVSKNDIVLSDNLLYTVLEEDSKYHCELTPEYKGVHVDVWYDELAHIKDQHVWIDNKVYKLTQDVPKDTVFNKKYGKLLVDNSVKLYKDENKSLLFENPALGDLVLSNNKLYSVKSQVTVDYVEQACALAMSIKNTNPNEKISLVTNDIVPKEYVNLFDKIIPIPFEDAAANSEWKIENRWKLYHASPYDETIVMDTDMLVLQNIDTWWKFLSNYELFFTSNVLNYRGDIADTRYYRKTFLDNNLPNLFSGLHYFKKCEFAQEFYQWLEIVVKNWGEFYKTHLSSTSCPTHMSIDVSCAIVAQILDCETKITNKIAKFPSFTHMKKNCQGWKNVQSSWQDQMGVYISKDGSLKIGNYLQTGVLHYTEKDFLQKSPVIERLRSLTNV